MDSAAASSKDSEGTLWTLNEVHWDHVARVASQPDLQHGAQPQRDDGLSHDDGGLKQDSRGGVGKAREAVDELLPK